MAYLGILAAWWPDLAIRAYVSCHPRSITTLKTMTSNMKKSILQSGNVFGFSHPPDVVPSNPWDTRQLVTHVESDT